MHVFCQKPTPWPEGSAFDDLQATMTLIASAVENTAVQPSSAVQSVAHPVENNWHQVMTQLASAIADRGMHPSRVVVLVPYAQLMQEARSAWSALTVSTGAQAAFMPRFETTMNWAASIAATTGPVATPDAALDDVDRKSVV